MCNQCATVTHFSLCGYAWVCGLHGTRSEWGWGAVWGAGQLVRGPGVGEVVIGCGVGEARRGAFMRQWCTTCNTAAVQGARGPDSGMQQQDTHLFLINSS